MAEGVQELNLVVQNRFIYFSSFTIQVLSVPQLIYSLTQSLRQ